MQALIGSILFAFFLSLSAIHFYWGFGGKWKANEAIPTKASGEKLFMPGKLDCFVVGICLLCLGVFVLIRSGFLNIPLPAFLYNNGLGFISFLFIVRAIGEFRYVGFFKKIKQTTFAKNDSKYYSPLCLIIGLLSLLLEILN